MKMRVILMVAMLALSGAAIAQSRGDREDGGDQGQAQGQLQGQAQLQAQGQAQGQGQLQGQSTNVDTRVTTNVGVATSSRSQSESTSLSLAQGGEARSTATGGNAVTGPVTSTNSNTNTATGGQGGDAVSVAAVEQGAVQNSNDYSSTYKEVRQLAPIGQGSFAIQGCGVAGNAGGSFPGGAGFLGFGFTPEQCYDFMLAQAYESLGEKKAACDILRNSKAGKRQEKRGVALPGCEPEVKTVVVPVPIDLSPYATIEDLNRAFKASQQK